MAELKKILSTKETRRETDLHVGKQLRRIRNLRGLSQQALAARINLTFQQLQKYERGTNRISASVLYEFSQILEVPIEDFFKGLSTVPSSPIQPLSKEHCTLLGLYDAAPKNVQKSLLKLLETMNGKAENA